MRRVDFSKSSSGESGTSDAPAAPDSGWHDFGDGNVEADRHVNPDGSTGGWIAFTANVEEASTVAPTARVFGNARVFGTARILGDATVCDNARVFDGAVISGAAMIGGESTINDAEVTDGAVVVGSAHLANGARIRGNARIGGLAKVLGKAEILGDARVKGKVWISGGTIGGSVRIDGNTVVKPGAVLTEDVEIHTGTFDKPLIPPAGDSAAGSPTPSSRSAHADDPSEPTPANPAFADHAAENELGLDELLKMA